MYLLTDFNRPFISHVLATIALTAVLSGCAEEKAETKEIIRPVKVV